MTTASTSRLGLALPVTGELSGTWGDTVNNSITSLLDSAIAGYTAITPVAATYVLSYSALIANEARSAALRFSTYSANYVVYAPPVSKVYVLWNDSGYSVTIYNSTAPGTSSPAGSGVTLANGDKVLVFSDGTNCYTLKADVNTTATQTLTNKRVTPRTTTVTTATSGSLYPNGDTTDQFSVTALTDLYTTIYSPSGTPTNGQRLLFRIKDGGGYTCNLTWPGGTNGYRAIGVTLPTTTVLGKIVYVSFVYNSTDQYWDAISVAQQT